MFNFWWSAKWCKQQKMTKMQKRPPKSSKNECSFLDYVQILMIGRAIQAMKVNRNMTKDPLSHQKWNAHFILHSTSDDQPSIRCPPPPQQKKFDFFKVHFWLDQSMPPLKNLSRMSTVLHQTFKTGLIFLIQLKGVQGVVCYDWNLQKCKYLSGISMVLHETFRTGFIFPIRLKWVQGVVCYNQTYKNVNISAEYQQFCMKPSEQGLFFQADQNESKEWYAKIKLTKM